MHSPLGQKRQLKMSSPPGQKRKLKCPNKGCHPGSPGALMLFLCERFVRDYQPGRELWQPLLGSPSLGQFLNQGLPHTPGASPVVLSPPRNGCPGLMIRHWGYSTQPSPASISSSSMAASLLKPPWGSKFLTSGEPLSLGPSPACTCSPNPLRA